MKPALRLLFPEDLTEQKKKLMMTLGVAIKSLRETEKLIPVLENLGRKHALYGVRDEHYDTVGAALLQSLRDALGAEFTDEAHAAWAEMSALSPRQCSAARGKWHRNWQNRDSTRRRR
jgi:hemoglobin-like flavoprotein